MSRITCRQCSRVTRSHRLRTPFRGKHAEQKREQREQVSQRRFPLAECEVLSEQDDVARLRVREHAAAPVVGVGVLKAARERQHDAEEQRV